MSFDDYANHIYQKHRLATALAVIKIKPNNITTGDFLEQLKSKINKMDNDDDMTVCSDDFLMDNDDGNDSETILKDFEEEIISHQIVIDDQVEPTHATENNSQITFYEPSQYTTENTSITYADTVKTAEQNHNSHENSIIQDIIEPKDLKTVKNSNFDLNAEMQLGEKHKNDINIAKKANDNTDATFYDSQETQLYSVPAFSQNYTHYSQSQNNISIPKQYLYKNSSKLDVDYENNPKDTIASKILEKTTEYGEKNEFNNVNLYSFKDNNAKETIVSVFSEYTEKNNENTESNNPNLHQFRDLTESISKNTYTDVISKKNKKIQENFGQNNTPMLQNSSFTENIPKNTQRNANLEKNNKHFGQNNTLDLENSSYSENLPKNTPTNRISGLNERNNENFRQNNTILLQSKDVTEENKIIEEDYDSDEIISYKVLEEFNKVKLFVRKPKRRMSNDSYSSDSGYKSDSQRSNRSALQLSGTWLNQSGSCLFHYLLQCPLVASTRDITNEIAQVLSELIDKLHDEEKYPSFLEEMLESIEVSLRQVFEGVNSEDNEFLKKDERIQRILLLNKSIHIQKHTMEKITTVLEEFHTNITKTDMTYEIQNIDEIENISYIFHILEILLKKYLKNRPNESQISTQNSQEDEKIFKKSSITDIWRKKWNPSQKKIEGSREKKCVLKSCGEILNKIVVDCLTSYSLVAYSALKCFNTMQN